MIETIIIDDGDTFEGSLEQFEDAFFSNATKENIVDFCKSNNMKLEFSTINPCKEKQDVHFKQMETNN